MVHGRIDAGVEKTYCSIISDIYQDSYFEIICDGCLSKEIDLTVGVKTGDPSSAFLFVISLDKHLKFVMDNALERGNAINPSQISSLPLGGYADDIELVSHKFDIFLNMVFSCKESIVGTGLYVRSDKCAILYDHRSGNRWYKSKSGRPPVVEFNGELVDVLARNECYSYLQESLSVEGESPTHITEIMWAPE